MIRVSKLTEIYRVPVRAPGLRGAWASLFRRKMREVLAVNAIDFEIRPDERAGFLGPNGAGRTTTLKMLSGLLVARRRIAPSALPVPPRFAGRRAGGPKSG